MFESVVATLLNRFLGSYIENFDTKQLNIGIWSGDVRLNDLRLRKESLDKFKLPLDVKFGHLGQLTLQIPWANLKGKPVKVIIEDVYLLASPIIVTEYDSEEDQRRQQSLKQEKLKDLEAIQAAANSGGGLTADLSSNESFTESLITKIVDNLQVTIKNIHIRYEDESVLTESPYALGLLLEELSAVSTDEGWTPSFIYITEKLTRKLLRLKSFACYMDTESESIFVEDNEKLLATLKKIFADPKTSHQYLLKPVSGEGHLTVHKAGATLSHPHIQTELFFDEFGVDFDGGQYRDILWTASKFHWYQKTWKFRRLRPKSTVQEDPKAWFRYAAKSVLDEIHEKNYKWSWDHFRKRRDQRKAYVSLWREKLLRSNMSIDDVSELEKLEMELSYEDIKFFRSLARSEVRKENLLTAATKPTTEPNSGGWFSWWGGAKKPSTTQEGEPVNGGLDISLTDEQRKALYDTIDYDENQDINSAIDIPRDRNTMEIYVTVRKAGISLKPVKNQLALAQVVVEGCTTQFFQRKDSYLAKFQLQELKVEDGSDKALYKHIVSVKHSHSSLHMDNVSVSPSPENEPFFLISFEDNPLDGSADSLMVAKLKSMTIFYNALFIDRVIKFFKPPKIHLDTVGAIMNAAEATMEGITSQTRLGLQYALEEHKTINVKLDLQAPLIILPTDPTNWKSPVAILDAGHISVTSDLVDNKLIEEIKAKETYSTEDQHKLNTLMYDKFNLHLQDAQFLVGATITDTLEQLHTQKSTLSAIILDNLDIKLYLGISILPEAVSLARFRVGGEIPGINIALNDFQYKTIMQLVDVIIPTSDSTETEEENVFDTFGNSRTREEIDDVDSNSGASSNFSRPEVVQHMFEMDFKIGAVNLHLSRCVDAVTLEAEHLVDLVGDSLNLFFYKTDFGMHLDLSLADIDLFDHIEKSGIPEFEKLLSSNNFLEEEAVVRKHRQLFRVEYNREQRIVEFNGKEIELFDQDVKVDMSAVKCVVSRKSYLSILNFVLNTFTDPNAVETPADELKHNDSTDEAAPQKIDVQVNLDSIIVVLNEDGIKLATLQLSTANINVFLLPEEMEVKCRLGALTLHDESNQGSPRNSIFRSLISIEGDNLAELTYKTHDMAKTSLPYQSSIEFVTAAAKVNFVEDAFGKILSYLSKFQRMKAIYDGAREAAINQANQIDNANKMKLNVTMGAPTIYFPKITDPGKDTCDMLVVKLGEMFLFNEFEMINNVVHNKITAGIRKVNLTTEINFGVDIHQFGKLMEDLDITFLIDHVEEYVPNTPKFTIRGKMPEIDMKLTELQLRYINNLQNSIAKVFDFADDDSLDDIEEDAEYANAVMKHNNKDNDKSVKIVKQPSKEITSTPHPDQKQIELEFEIPRISLTLYNKTTNLSDFESKKLTFLSINGFQLTLSMNDDSSFSSDMFVNSFTIKDVRPGTENKFTEIIPPLDDNEKQLLVGVSSTANGEQKSISLVGTITKPKCILALDHIFELQAFVDKGMEVDTPVILDYNSGSSEDDSFTSEEPQQQIESSSTKFGFSINIIEPSIILLADSAKSDTEAIVFKVEQVMITSQNIVSLAANNIGMFVVTMDNFSDQRLRIIDDFSVSFSFDDRGSTPTNLLTNIELSVDALLLRISLRDIRLAMQIFGKANDLYSRAHGFDEVLQDSEYKISEDFKSKLSKYAPSIVSSFTTQMTKRRKLSVGTSIIVKGEEFSGTFGGARLVLIGDVHELPVLDMNVKPFETKILNWSNDLSAEIHLESFVNIYNYSKSTWEPLLEPWPIAVYASKRLLPTPSMVVDVVSRQVAELSVSSRSVALLSQIFSSITTEQSLKPRDEITPYVIVNETGFDIEVWTDGHKLTKEDKKVITCFGRAKWAFEDWRKVRENLSTDNVLDALGIKLIGSSYNEVYGISVSGEGEEIFVLQPPVNGVHSRLACEITLGVDNVKTVVLRSTVKVQNESDTGLSLLMVKNDGDISAEINVLPNESVALPIDSVYNDRLKVKPQLQSNFSWSAETIAWKDLMRKGTPLSCSSVDNPGALYYFQAEAKYDSEEPLAKIYPHLTIVISAPLEIENLLPYDLNFRLYDKSAKRDWSGDVEKGCKTFVHVVSLESLLLLSVEPVGYGFGKSEFAIVNSLVNGGFKRESSMTMKNSDGLVVRLRIFYPKRTSNSGLKIVIYSPYVILNRTGQDLLVSERNNSSQRLMIKSRGELGSIPHLFSFARDEDRQNRAVAKLGDSVWSTPLSFDAIGQNTGTKAQVNGKQSEMNFGISVAEGEGKYKLSKVITFAPRYIVRNNLKEPIMLVENGSTNQFELEAGAITPLYHLRRLEQKSIMIRFAHGGRAWSSPFGIDDIGQLFLKAHKENYGQVLLKVNIITENSSIFVEIENANNNWPFSIKNFTDTEFFIYQSDPNKNSNGEIVKQEVDFKPIYYKIPPRSVMPYAYDYPSGVVKDLIIRSHGRERAVNLAEIGNLKPFRLPPIETERQVIVDLNVVADGPTLSLVISEYNPSVSLYKLRGEGESSTSLSQLQFQIADKDENYHTKVMTRFEGFGISLINGRNHELCYITLKGIEFRYNESDLYQNLSAKVKWIQIDNQLYGGIFPIILYPTIVPKSGKEMNNHPSFSAAVCKVKDDTHGVLFLKYATVLLQEMSVEVDEDFLFALLDFSKFPGASWNSQVEDKLCDDNLKIPEPKKLGEASDIYFEALHLQPTLMNLSFVRTERVNAEDRTSTQNTLMFFVNMLTMAIGNINDAPIKLNALFMENVRVPTPILMDSISTHYGQSFFYQLHKILGSADFLGNPVGLFNNLSSGVIDIFYEPYQGFVLNDRPQELGIGLAKGGLSFLKKSVFGFSDSFAKVTGSLAKGLSVATMDRKFQERRRLNQRRNKPKHALYGFTSGANSFFDSVSSGFAGVAQAPLEGAAKDGAGGFFKGLGKGLVGLPTKTAIGFFDLASNVSEGIRNTTTVFDTDGLEKVRLPRYISYDGVIRPYSQREAQGQFWLKSIDGGAFLNETYLAHLVMAGEEQAVIVTFRKVILFYMNTMEVSWIVSFDQIKTLSLESTGIAILLKKRNGPFIPIPEKKSRYFLYSRFKIAVDKFNAHCQVEL